MAAAGTAARKVWHWRGRSFMRMLAGTWVVGRILKSSVVWPRLAPLSPDLTSGWTVREPPPPLLVTADSHCSGLRGETGVFLSIPSWGGLQGLIVGRQAVFQVKMHFSIPETEVRSGENGSTYVVSMMICFVLFLFCFTRFHLTSWLQLATSRANVQRSTSFYVDCVMMIWWHEQRSVTTGKSTAWCNELYSQWHLKMLIVSYAVTVFHMDAV